MTLEEAQRQRREALAAYVKEPTKENRKAAQAAVDAEKAAHARLKEAR